MAPPTFMDIKFKITHDILKKNGFKIKEFSNNKDYVKRIRKGDEFPRYHIAPKDDGTYQMHIDNQRRHGFYMKWLFGTKGNGIINNSSAIQKEIMKLKLDHYEKIVDEIKLKIIEVRNGII